jgi:predicted permease
MLIILVFGNVLKKSLLSDSSIWDSLNKVNFNALIPCLILHTLLSTSIQSIAAFEVLLTISISLIVVMLILYLLYQFLVPKHLDGKAYTSVFQTSTRWNVSIALVVINTAFDSNDIAIVALIMVAIMPLVNIVNISMMVKVLSKEPVSMGTTIKKVLKNPIIVSCLLGISLSIANTPVNPEFLSSLELLGNASITTILLCIGAGLSLNGCHGKAFEIIGASFLKLVLMPLLVLLIGLVFRIDVPVLMVMIVAVSAPTAMNGYAVAKEMGGDSALYASIGTVQTLLSLIVIPSWITIAQMYVGPMV